MEVSLRRGYPTPAVSLVPSLSYRTLQKFFLMTSPSNSTVTLLLMQAPNGSCLLAMTRNSRWLRDAQADRPIFCPSCTLHCF